MASTHIGSTKSENHSSNSTALKNFEGSQNNNGGRGGGKGRGRGRGGRGKGRGGGENQTQTQAQTQNSGGNSNVEGVFGPSPTNIVCQICFHPGHSAVSCPSRYAQTSNAALAGLPTGEHNETTWFPDSGASSHMTNDQGQPVGGGASQSF